MRGCRVLENWVVSQMGGVKRRRGMRYFADALSCLLYTSFVLLAHQKVWSAFEALARTPEKVNITDLIQHLEAAGELESCLLYTSLCQSASL